jgi:NAD-dependent SIR2 family protein deacetylase
MKTPRCMHCGEEISETNLGIEFTERQGPIGIWQCADCHEIEWGTRPHLDILQPGPVCEAT